jgi:hypothetical protein
MNRIQNKHGPDVDIGVPVIRRPRDGTERKPRDGTEGMPRDGTERKPRDGTEGMPRDGTERKPRDGTERKPRDGTEGMPRDGTERKPRDGTERKPRDGTEGKSRDGTKRKARDKIILWKDTLVIRYFYLLTAKPQDVRIHGRPSFRWRKSGWKRPAFRPVMGEVRPVANEK